jgi:YidC/Oxa1 family membrane protein insertase
MKALQQKYKNDKQRLNEEMMKFYRENKVNPLGSCLPLLLQLPVFIALFYLLREDLKQEICPQYVADEVPPQKLGDINCGDSPIPAEADAAQFLFIPDLTNNAAGWVLVVLILMYVGSQLASSLLMSTTADKNQRRLILALPLIFVPFIIGFPAGLLVYWITTNVWTMGQQYTIRRIVGPIRPPGQESLTSGGGIAGLLGLGGDKDEEADAGRAAGKTSGGGKGKAATEAANGKAANGKAEVQKGQKAKPPPRSGPPPRSPRKKKKRSGRRR